MVGGGCAEYSARAQGERVLMEVGQGLWNDIKYERILLVHVSDDFGGDVLFWHFFIYNVRWLALCAQFGEHLSSNCFARSLRSLTSHHLISLIPNLSLILLCSRAVAHHMLFPKPPKCTFPCYSRETCGKLLVVRILDPHGL